MSSGRKDRRFRRTLAGADRLGGRRSCERKHARIARRRAARIASPSSNQSHAQNENQQAGDVGLAAAIGQETDDLSVTPFVNIGEDGVESTCGLEN
jgi:hypothetical protein